MAVTAASSHWLSRLVSFVFTVLIAGLTALFWIELFSPGNSLTSWIFTLLLPVTYALEQVYHFVGYPVRLVSNYFLSFMPIGVLEYFPTTTVKTLVTSFLNLFKAVPGFYNNGITQAIYHWNYESWFPGVIDWEILLTVKLLGFAEGFLTPKQKAVFSSDNLDKLIEDNRRNFLDQWNQNQPFTPETLTPPAPVPIANYQNVLPEYAANTMSFDEQVRPAVLPPAMPQPKVQVIQPSQPGNDPETGLMNRQAFQILFDTQFNWTQKHKNPIGIVWLELSTLAVAPPVTLNQLGRWLSNLTTQEGRIVPARYGAHSIVVLLVNQTPDQARMVANHLQQRLSEFNFAPLTGLSHSSNSDITLPTSQEALIQEAYQSAIRSNQPRTSYVSELMPV